MSVFKTPHNLRFVGNASPAYSHLLAIHSVGEDITPPFSSTIVAHYISNLTGATIAIPCDFKSVEVWLSLDVLPRLVLFSSGNEARRHWYSQNTEGHGAPTCPDAWFGIIGIFCGYSRFRACSRYEEPEADTPAYCHRNWNLGRPILCWLADEWFSLEFSWEPGMGLDNAGLYNHHIYDGLHGFLSSHMAQVLLVLPCKQSPKRLLAILTNWSEDIWIGEAYH